MENIAFRRNDSLLILDEISEISPSKAGDVAYMLANGQGKKRLDKNCNARETYSWTLIFLSSGEVDLSSHMAEDSKTSKAGQKVRLLNIPAKASKDSCGIFENLMGFQDGAEFSDYLRENTSKYYGIASVEFIKHVLNHRADIRDSYKEEFFRLKSLYLPKNAEGQDMRAFERFMLVGFAGELAIKYGVVCWKPETSYSAAVACFNSWLEDKDGVGDDENRQIIDQVKSFFELHGHSRFFDLDGYSDQKILNMAGYKRVYKDEVTFFVSPSVFQKEICKNFNRKTVISLLIDQGFLLKDHNGDYRQQKWTPDGNKKVYVISGNVLL
jgi:putative DNA primase/helicase